MPLRVEVDHDGKTQWCPAFVTQVGADGSIEATIRDAVETWEDTFAWHEEGSEWKRDVSEDAAACPLPPAGWAWLAEGETLEVEVEHEGVTRWWPAVVATVLSTGAFEARITDDVATWMDWLSWQEEGKDWRRATGARAGQLSSVSLPLPGEEDASGSEARDVAPPADADVSAGASSQPIASPSGHPSSPSLHDLKTAPLAKGDRVSAKYKAQQYGSSLTKWYTGVIAAVHTAETGSSTYDITFEDGDEEHRVPRHFIRPWNAIGSR